jgi:glycosyltransferase involved in cell wall biosynthesis
MNPLRQIPEISVVIPLYNKQEYIKRCMSSVLNQEVLPGEIIVIDDGSTDLSVNIVKQFLDGYYDTNIVLLRQKNKGVSSARNCGIRIAKNSYIAFLDADDYWFPAHLKNLTDAISQFPCSALYIANSVNSSGKPLLLSSLEFLKLYSKKMKLVHTSGIAVSRDVALSVGCFPDSKRSQDIAFWLSCCLSNTVVFTGEKTSFFDKSATGLVTRKNIVPAPVVCSNFILGLATDQEKKYVRKIIKKNIFNSLIASSPDEVKLFYHIVMNCSDRTLLDRRLYSLLFSVRFFRIASLIRNIKKSFSALANKFSALAPIN